MIMLHNIMKVSITLNRTLGIGPLSIDNTEYNGPQHYDTKCYSIRQNNSMYQNTQHYNTQYNSCQHYDTLYNDTQH